MKGVGLLLSSSHIWIGLQTLPRGSFYERRIQYADGHKKTNGDYDISLKGLDSLSRVISLQTMERILKVTRLMTGNRERCRKLSLWNRSWRVPWWLSLPCLFYGESHQGNWPSRNRFSNNRFAIEKEKRNRWANLLGKSMRLHKDPGAKPALDFPIKD